MAKKKLKVAIVCDWLVGTGGAERVVLELHRMFPDAPIYTSQYRSNPKIWYGDKWFSDAKIKTLWLQNLPKSLRKYLPVFRAWAFSKLDLSEYDIVISSSGAEAKGVKTSANTKHIAYCHAPTHYYWSRYDEYMENPGFGPLNPLARLGLKLLVGPLRKWDYKAAQKPDYFIANSNHTKDQIKKYYNRDAVVVHPPVDIDRFKPKGRQIRNGFLVAGRQTPYKSIDLAVAACTELGKPLTVIGNGPEHNKLVDIAGPRVTFLTRVSDAQMAQHFQSAEAFIFPGIDDFGIVAVEAIAAGTPVIALKAGGALDYVKDGKTGKFFEAQTIDSLVNALKEFDSSKFKNADITKSATQYTPQSFNQKIQDFLDNHIEHAQSSHLSAKSVRQRGTD
jgi:glycosyltransferase involved in cell wall biosynthesis